jgi:hypothetical protein
MTKEKIALSVAALFLTFILSITGTLMYFTAESPKAVNVVTMKGLDVYLEETGPGSTSIQIVKDGDGLKYEDVTPGDTLVKSPKVHTSESSVKSFIRVSFKLAWYSQDGATPFDGAELESVNTAILNSLKSQAAPNWLYEDGYFYYVANTGTQKLLRELSGNVVTEPVFQTLTIPANLPNSMQRKVLKIDLQAEAIQSAGQTQDGSSALSGYFA